MDGAASPVGVATKSPAAPSAWPDDLALLPPQTPPPVALPTEPMAWSRPAQATTAALLLVAVALVSWHAYTAHRSACRPTDVERPEDRLDLNQADAAQLRQLRGVGDNMARRIADHRREHGPFRHVEELAGAGVGPKTRTRLREQMNVGMDEEDLPAERAPLLRMGGKAIPAEPVDINTAGVELLQRLPHIGPTIARRIIEVRNKKPFQSIEDLRRVKGIGPTILEQIRPHVRVKKD